MSLDSVGYMESPLNVIVDPSGMLIRPFLRAWRSEAASPRCLYSIEDSAELCYALMFEKLQIVISLRIV